MKHSYLILLLIITGIGFSALQVETKYVCRPCGNPCDGTVYDKPGTCPACSMPLVDQRTVSFKNIDFGQLCTRIKANKGIILLDVRSKEEFNNTMAQGNAFGRFKNAININITDLASRVAELNQYKDKEVVVYCSHSHRSPEASYFLVTHGFKNVKNVSGGVSVLATDPNLVCLKDQYIAYPVKR